MSNHAASFVEAWVRENAVKPVEGAPAGDTSEARLRAERPARSRLRSTQGAAACFTKFFAKPRITSRIDSARR